jgi:hypothetical protein
MSEYSGMTEELPCIFHTDDNNKKPWIIYIYIF